MISLQVREVKRCMNELLCQDSFDFFLLSEATINTFASFVIDGHRLDDYYTQEELIDLDTTDSLMPYSYFREYCYDIIKGTKEPLSFKIVLTLPTASAAEIIASGDYNISPDDVHLIMIVKFFEGKLTVTTYVSFDIFFMDKGIEHAFDKWIISFLEERGIDIVDVL